MESLTSEQCRQRAKECRELGRAHHDAVKRKEFDDLASAWEQLCEEIEKQAKRD
jgi:hypothetical protein